MPSGTIEFVINLHDNELRIYDPQGIVVGDAVELAWRVCRLFAHLLHEPDEQVLPIPANNRVDSFMDPQGVNVNFRVTFHPRLVVAPRGGSTASFDVTVLAK